MMSFFKGCGITVTLCSFFQPFSFRYNPIDPNPLPNAMLIPVLLLIAGFVLLTFGAAKLVDGSSALALKLGLTPLIVGITVVAFGTSAPELVVSVRATIAGNSAIAIGNVIGSNIANIALILGLAAIIRPLLIHKSLLRMDVPLMIGITLAASMFIINDSIGRIEGAILFFGTHCLHRVQYPSHPHPARRTGSSVGGGAGCHRRRNEYG